MHIREAATAAYNLYWAGSKNEDECWRICEIWCGVCGIDEVDVSYYTEKRVLKLCMAWRDGGLMHATLNRRLAVLSKLLCTAHDLGGLKALPRFKRFKEAGGIERVLTPDEQTRLFTHVVLLPCAEDRDLLCNAYEILLHTGARVGELFATSARDLSLDDTRGSHDVPPDAQVRPRWFIPVSKNGKPRTIPLTIGAARAFREQLKKYAPLPFGQAITRSRFSHLWDRVRKSAGLHEIRLHDLRHTFASRLVSRGRGIYDVQHLLGHASVVTTMRYAHLDTSRLDGAIDLLESTE